MTKSEEIGELKEGGSTNCFSGSVIHIPTRPHFAGDYRLEYDGKYITLLGKDNRYEGFRFADDQEALYEEMVLISCVVEARKATPTIKEVTDKYIAVDLGYT